jgi:hypothetical protein
MKVYSLGFTACRLLLLTAKKSGLLAGLLTAVLVPSALLDAQTRSSFPALPATCPIQFLHFRPSNDVTVKIRNTSGKKIVGLVFNAALADATEHWKWYHWDFDDYRPVRDFGWNKVVKVGAANSLDWPGTDLDFMHGGGGAFVLTSALFEDGSAWEAPGGQSPCMCLWYSKHKKGGLIRPVRLPPIPPKSVLPR